MQIQKTTDGLSELAEKLKELLEQIYRKQLSEAIKRGIRAKKQNKKGK